MLISNFLLHGNRPHSSVELWQAVLCSYSICKDLPPQQANSVGLEWCLPNQWKPLLQSLPYQTFMQKSTTWENWELVATINKPMRLRMMKRQICSLLEMRPNNSGLRQHPNLPWALYLSSIYMLLKLVSKECYNENQATSTKCFEVFFFCSFFSFIWSLCDSRRKSSFWVMPFTADIPFSWLCHRF